MRLALRLLMWACILVLLFFLGGAVWLYLDLEKSMRSQPPQPPLPALLRGLDQNVDKSRQQFAARVRQHFPAGTDAAVMRDLLRQDGFSIDQGDWGERASFEHRELFCVLYWSISWRRDSEGRAQDVQEHYMPSCL